MVSVKSADILELVRKVCSDATFDYIEPYKQLNLDRIKKPIVFNIRIKDRMFEMGGMRSCFKKFDFFVVVKCNKLYEFLEFIKVNKIVYIELFISRAKCSKKWFNHWDLKSVRFYPYCKITQPVLSYYCYPDCIDNSVKKRSYE